MASSVQKSIQTLPVGSTISYLKRKNRCAADSGFIVIFCFQKNQANIADAVTIKALPASDSSIGAANGHSNSATIAEAAACA